MTLLSQAAAQADFSEEIVPLHTINTVAGTQARIALDLEIVTDYREVLRTAPPAQPWPFPPIKIVRDATVAPGAYPDPRVAGDYLVDGFHRVEAARLENFTLIPALIRPGTRRDAVLAAVGANSTHGLRRSNADKRNAVTILLLDPEWSQWSDNVIKDIANVSQPFVSKLRAELIATQNGYKSPDVRLTANGRTINTAPIGHTRPTPPAQDPPFPTVWELEAAVRTWLAQPHVQAKWARNQLPTHLRTIASRYPASFATIDLADYLPPRRRKRDIVQALNNLAEQLAQVAPTPVEAALAAPGPVPAAPVAQHDWAILHLSDRLAQIRQALQPTDEVLWYNLFANTHYSDLVDLIRRLQLELNAS